MAVAAARICLCNPTLPDIHFPLPLLPLLPLPTYLPSTSPLPSPPPSLLNQRIPFKKFPSLIPFLLPLRIALVSPSRAFLADF